MGEIELLQADKHDHDEIDDGEPDRYSALNLPRRR
jgi:hypothetical protein